MPGPLPAFSLELRAWRGGRSVEEAAAILGLEPDAVWFIEGGVGVPVKLWQDMARHRMLSVIEKKPRPAVATIPSITSEWRESE
jgi:hypothetical protein